jgi:drug/metabolite transporter (DMT)-like permease
MAVPMVFMTLAFEDLPVSLGGLLVALIPLATFAAAHFLVEGERLQVKTLPGLLTALAGTALLVGVGTPVPCASKRAMPSSCAAAPRAFIRRARFIGRS